MPKDSLKDNLDGNELDLSLNNLSVVPVKELMTIPKATHLDLSCNVLISLPDGFCNLQHLVKIDLSKNHLTSLPTKFGSLTNLQHLDLLGNQLEKLPLSFCHLEKLKWLDLKDNPLDAGLKKAAGDCLDETQCRKCAKSVLAYMKTVSSEAERKKQKQLQEQREREAAEKKKEDEERERKKAEKKAEREKRKQQHQAKQEQELAEKKEARVEKSDKSEVCNGPPTKARTVQKKSCLGKCCFWIFAVLILALAITVGVHVYCNENKGHDLCKTHYVPVMNQAHAKYEKLRVYVETFTKEQFRKETFSDSPRHDTKDTKNTRDTDDTDETF